MSNESLRERASDQMHEMLEIAHKSGASDLFISAGFPPSIKCHGVMRTLTSTKLTPEASRAYALSIMNKQQQDEFAKEMECNFAIDLGFARFRVNVYVQRQCIGMVIRTIPTEIPSFDKLQLPAILKDIVMAKRGLVFMVGSSGSGKSTSLAAMIDHRNTHSTGHIITIEDPIEYIHESKSSLVTQREISVDTHNWKKALKNGLRQSPDVIMIGEIRDAETAETAVWAANSGVLVLSTIHAPSAAEAIQSLRGFGVPAAFISTCLRGVVNVRLVRTLCPVCREAVATGDEARQHFREIESRLNPGDGTLRFAPHGCDQCHQTGYGGRVGVFEVMPVSDNVRDMILKGRSARQIRARAYQEGVMTLREAALMKAAQGLTTLEEVRRIIPGPQRLPQGEKKGAKSIDREYPTDGEAAATTLARG
jgi:twitching motility protein PilU